MFNGKKKKKKKKTRPFAAVEHITVESEAWQSLTKSEPWVYTILKTFYKGDSQKFKAPFNEIKKRSRIKHGDTINKAIQGLEVKGWIEVTRYAKHGKRRGLRVKPNEYKLTFRYDYRRW